MLAVTPLKPDRREQVLALLPRSRFRPWRILRGAAADQVESLWMKEIDETLGAADAVVFVAQAGQNVKGLAACADQSWDTRVLERKCAVLKHLVVPDDDAHSRETMDALLREILAWSQRRGIEFLSCKTQTDDTVVIQALERRGFLLMDTILDYVYEARRDPFAKIPPPQTPGCTIRPARADDQDALEQLAGAAFTQHFGRFHADSRLPRDVSTRVYREWIRSACAGYADYVFVADLEGVVAGFSVWRKPTAAEQQHGLRVGHYSIGAVHPDFAGRGLFSALTWAGMAALHDSVDWLESPTHVNNYPVQRGMEKTHWHIGGARHTLHRWLTDD